VPVVRHPREQQSVAAIVRTRPKDIDARVGEQTGRELDGLVKDPVRLRVSRSAAKSGNGPEPPDTVRPTPRRATDSGTVGPVEQWGVVSEDHDRRAVALTDSRGTGMRRSGEYPSKRE
jgi:hypothetical protein